MLIGFIIGFFVGGLFGVFIMALAVAASRGEEIAMREQEEYYGKEAAAPAAGRR